MPGKSYRGINDIMNRTQKQPPVISLFRDIAPAAAYWREAYEKLSDADLRRLSESFLDEAGQGVPIRRLLPRVFGAAGESCRRNLGLLPYPVQYRAGASLASGEIAQMNTGEGKSLTAILPACYRALEGRGVHVVTVNEYLARRDFEMNRPVIEALGLRAGLSLSGMTVPEKQAAYRADVTYSTATELGFDFLRDGVATDPAHRVLRGLNFAIVDEADSIFLDEAVTPMILSSGGTGDIRDYKIADTFARYLQSSVFAALDEDAETDDMAGDYIVDERHKNTVLTASGIETKPKNIIASPICSTPRTSISITASCRLSAPTGRWGGMWTISSGTARSASSTAIRAGSWRADAFPAVSIRPSRPRNAPRSIRRAAYFLRSPTKNSFRCIRVYPA
jgi:preprotein translocase subunit SecA